MRPINTVGETFIVLMTGVKMADANSDKLQRHWTKTRNLTWLVLILWAIFAFVLPGYAKELNSMTFIGFPLGYYFCVQGSLIVFVLLIFFQNWRQDAIDDEAGLGE
jgi:putative solute:sodium symporter small subunit